MSNRLSSKKFDEDFENNPFDFDIGEILGTINSGKSSKIEKSKKLIKEDDSSDNIFDQPKKISFSETFASSTNTTFKKANNCSTNDEKATPISIPSDWAMFLNENISGSNDNKNFKSSISNRKWLEKIFNLLESLPSKRTENNLKKKAELLNEYEVNLWTGHYRFVLKCCQAFSLHDPTMLRSNFNPQSIYKFFKGELPWSPTNEKITKNYPFLFKILIDSFR